VLLKRPYFLLFLLSVSLNVNAQLHADFAANIQQGCSPLIVQFTDLSTGHPTKWLWDLGNGAVSSLKNPGATYVNPGVYTVKLHITDNSGNEDSIVKVNYITVYENPAVELTAFPTQGCAPLKVQFTDESKAGSGTLSQWFWDFGDGNISDQEDPLHIYNNPGNFNVSLTVVNSFGCRKTLQQPGLIKIAGTLNADFTYSYDNACKAPATVRFTNLSQSQSPINYQWFFGDGFASTDKNPVHVYSTSGSFTVQLVTINATGCSDTATQLISIGSAKADFSYSNACIDKNMVFTDQSTPKAISQKWDFGDGSSATGPIVQHTYSALGTYQVTLIADFGGCYDTIKKTIETRKSVHADFTASGNLISCSYPETITFTNTSQGSTEYKWFFGDNSQPNTETNPVHVYNDPGMYSVKLIAYDQGGCADSIIKTDLVQIGPPVIEEIENLPASGCAPKSITMKPVISSGHKIISYKWDFGDGTSSADSAPNHTYKNPGSYTVTLIVNAQGGCSDTLTLPNAVALGVKPDAAFSADPLTTCAQIPVQFTDETKGNPTTWYWLFGDGATSSDQNPLHNYIDTGFFSISLIVSQNLCYDTITLNNYVHIDGPIAQFFDTVDCDNPFSVSFKDASIDAQTWLWDFGDGTTSTDESPSHTYTATGNYIVTLTVANDKCSYKKIDSMNIIKENPSFNVSGSEHNCKYDSISFSATNYNADNIIAFQWDFGDGTRSSNSKANASLYHQYNVNGIYFPKLVVTDANNCRSNVQQNTNIKVYGPNAAFSNPPGTCVQSTIDFTDQSTGDGTSSINRWIWDYGDSTKMDTLASAPFEHTYTATGSYNVFLKVIDNDNCYDTVTNIQAVNITQPIAAFSAVDSLSCVLGSIQFIDSASGESLSYHWDFGDGKTSTDPAPSHIYSHEGVYDVKLSLTDKFGCRDSLFKPQYVTVADPVADFSITDSLFACPPATVSPQNNSFNYSSLTWNFGDSATSTEISPQHNYTMGGNYRLTLITQGFGNCFDTAMKKIFVKGPSGKLVYAPNVGCDSLRVAFSASAQNTVEYIWDFGNGDIKNTTDSQMNYLYVSTGNFLPKLVIGDTAGCRVPIVTNDTLIVSSVKANFLSTLVKGTCDSTRFDFTDSSKVSFDKITTYKWRFGDGDSSSAQNPIHFYKRQTTYNVQLSTITNNGCVSKFAMPVNVLVDTTTHIFASAPDSACASEDVLLTAGAIHDPNANLSWLWDLGDGSKAYSKDTTYSYQNAGQYNLYAVGKSSNGCADTATVMLYINPLPPVDAGLNAAICLGSSAVLKATGAQTYLWNDDPDLSCIYCAEPIAKPRSTATYFLKGTSSVGCSAYDSVIVKVAQPPVVSMTAPDTACSGDLIHLTASGASVYNWQPATLVSNASDSTAFSRPLTTTTYTVIGKDELNCFNDTASVRVNVFKYPTVKITDSIVNIGIGDSYQIKTESSPDITLWQWTPPNGLSCTDCAQPLVEPTSSQVYKVHVENIAGCFAENQVSILVSCKNENLFIPNTFSPNADGMNDYFYPRGRGVSTIKSIRIFSRWGTLIFARDNVPANQQSYGWDGSYNGKAMPTDVYIYVVEVLCDNGTILTTKGNLTLLR
jgi:gliding motility-associated-like protein